MKTTAVLCAAAVTAAMAFTSFGSGERQTADSAKQAQTPVFEGTIVSVEDERLTMLRRFAEGGTEEVVVMLGEETKLLDAVNGYPMELTALKKGDPIRAYVGGAMTLSLPPIVNGKVILAGVPADAAFPSYTTVTSCIEAGENLYRLTTAEGDVYTIDTSTTLLPYLTRNMVYATDLTEGREILLWNDEEHAEKVVLFPEAEDETNQSDRTGWERTDGEWRYYEQGEIKTGWLLYEGDWYYLNPETGIMQTGFLTLEGKTYYLTENGKMLTKQRTFTPDENGVLH
ncbi:MAG: hypothetical protein HFE83_11060 [Lachnospiraceae bacterium]|nr:hypothetical protein [Lachnospiraceae bacterium]